MQGGHSHLACAPEGRKGTYLKSKLLTYTLDVQERAGLVQRVPKMIDIPAQKSQLFYTCVSLGGLSNEGHRVTFLGSG